jgi:hypothetical protein
MSKREYVEFTGILPKELIGAKKPIYGRVVKRSKSKQFLTVKPKHRSYEVTVDEADVTVVPVSKFTKKHKKKKPSTAKKTVAKKPAVKKDKPKAVKKKPVLKTPAPKVEKVEKPTTVKVLHPNGSTSKPKPCETKKDFPGVSKAAEEAKDTLVKSPPPVTRPVIKEDPVKPPVVKGDDIARATPIKEVSTPSPEVVEEHHSGGGVVIYVVIALIAAAAVGSYYLFF